MNYATLYNGQNAEKKAHAGGSEAKTGATAGVLAYSTELVRTDRWPGWIGTR